MSASPIVGASKAERTLDEAAARAECVLRPRSIAIIGASTREGSLHGRILPNLLGRRFSGEIFPVNPRYEQLSGLPCYPSVGAIGRPVDLALILVGAPRVIEALDGCIDAGIRAALVFAAGFAEAGGDGQALQAELVKRRDQIVVAGPNVNCILSQPADAALGFGPTLEFPVLEAPRAIVSQSGAVGTAVVTRATGAGLGFRYVIATGNEADLGVEDYLSFLATETGPVRSCLLFLEVIRDVRRFAEAAAACRHRGIRLIAYKVGSSEQGRVVTSTHTAAMAGPIALYQALFEKLGIWAVDELDDLHHCAQLDVWDERPGRLAAVSFSGGQAAVMADAFEDHGLLLADLAPETIDRVSAATGTETLTHPFDCGGQVVNEPTRWAGALDALSAQDDVAGLVVGLSAVAGGRDSMLTDVLVDLSDQQRNVALAWSSGTDPQSTVPCLPDRGIPVFDRIEDCAACLRIRQDHVSGTAASERELAGYIRSLNPSGGFGSPSSLDAVVEAAGVTIPFEVECHSLDEVLAAFTEVDGHVALKAAKLLHKSGAGGVVIGLADEQAVLATAEEMLAAHGFPLLVQEHVSGLREVIVGISRTELGVAVVVGAGGILAEFIDDSVTMLAPLDPARATEAIERLKIARLLAGYRGLKPVGLAPIVTTAVTLGELALEDPCIDSIDLNPIIVSDDGAQLWAVDRKLVRRGRE
jgi:acyl-CoA synthetase (NDP forming)